MGWNRFIREPLVHFFILGAAVFFINDLVNPREESPDSNQIIIDDDDVERLITQYKQVWNDQPSPSTIEKLIEQYIQSEVMYREALNLNLDHNDEIIKRRLKQKFEFLVRDLISANQPTDDELKAYYADHKTEFNTEALYSFYQFYFSPDKRSKSMEDAHNFMKTVASNSETSISEIPRADPSHLKQHYKNVSAHQIRQEFGLSFADVFHQVKTDSWTGPVTSGYGVHVIYVDQISYAESAAFNDVKDRVIEAFEKDRINQYNDNMFESMLDNYSIDINLDKWSHVLN